jgi:lipoprotein-releasing system permease protein
MKFTFWLSYTLLKGQGKKFFSLSTGIAIAGLVIGVASLVVSMAVMSGFERTLKESIISAAGHLQVLGYGFDSAKSDDFFARLKKIDSRIQGLSGFYRAEGILVGNGQTSGAILQGFDFSSINDVLNIKKRIIEGVPPRPAVIEDSEVDLRAWIGKGIAKKFDLKTGDSFKAVLPISDGIDPNTFRRKIANFKVEGVLDLIKSEYDDRFIMLSLKTLQDLTQAKNKISGFVLRVNSDEQAREVRNNLIAELGSSYRITDWYSVNENLFDAVKYERLAIFFVIFVIVLAAAFNVISSLYIHMVKKTKDISILKSLGLSNRQLSQVFQWQSFFISFVGISLGFALGLGLCSLFTWLVHNYNLIPGSVYRIDKIQLYVRAQDALLIVFTTVVICIIAALPPAFRAMKMSPISGLREDT